MNDEPGRNNANLTQDAKPGGAKQGGVAPISVMLLLFSLAGSFLALKHILSETDITMDLLKMPANPFSGLVALALLSSLSVVVLLARSQTTFRVAASLKLILLCLLVNSVALPPFEETLITCAYLLELVAYEGVLVNFFAALVASMVVLMVGFRYSAPSVPGGHTFAFIQLFWSQRFDLFLLEALVSLLGTLVFYYREMVIATAYRNQEIEDTLKRLNEANIGYLNYSANVSELSKTEERNRITREIHDIVGYSFVTNLMMLEASKDLVRKDQERGIQLIEDTRANLERGLKEIRRVLYLLRVNAFEVPMDLNKILRMTLIIQKVTNIEISLSVPEISTQLDGDIGLFLFSFLQETIVNAYLHGKATRVTISLTAQSGRLVFTVSDNGTGTPTLREGLGIQGIRERLGMLGGVLTFINRPYGFEVTAEIPDRTQKDIENYE